MRFLNEIHERKLMKFIYTPKYIKNSVLKVKVKLSCALPKHHAMKAYQGSGGIAARIL
jgi:hypothetical protein